MFKNCKFPVGEQAEKMACLRAINKKKIRIEPGANKEIVAAMFAKGIRLKQKTMRGRVHTAAKKRFDGEQMFVFVKIIYCISPSSSPQT